MIVETSQKRKGVKLPLHSSTELYGEKPMTLQPEYSLGESTNSVSEGLAFQNQV